MRIVHISDIHLSIENFSEFENNYRKALLKVLSDEHQLNKPIDIIAITGDLVDKGGHSLFEMDRFKDYSNPYQIFEEEFITPIKNELGFGNSKFLFIPGNHDINENEILWVDEKNLQDDEVKGNINNYLSKNRTEFSRVNDRIKLFKNFESEFHKDTINYTPSFNESTFIYETSDGVKVGFALINDSWRCSTCQLHKHYEKKLYFGFKQLYDGLKILNAHQPTMNVLLTHHPISSYAEEEVRRIVTNHEYHLHLYGDKHNHGYDSYITPTGKCFGIMARAALNKPDESESKWQPGFHIIDIDFNEALIETIIYYKYIYSSCQFGFDTDTAAPSGYDTSKHSLSFKKIERESKIKKEDLDKSKFFKP